MSQKDRPRADAVAPRLEGVHRAGLGRQGLSAPAIVIATDPQHVDPGIAKVGQRRQHPKARARHRMPPREPEVEQVAHDDERAGATG